MTKLELLATMRDYFFALESFETLSEKDPSLSETDARAALVLVLQRGTELQEKLEEVDTQGLSEEEKDEHQEALYFLRKHIARGRMLFAAVEKKMARAAPPPS